MTLEAPGTGSLDYGPAVQSAVSSRHGQYIDIMDNIVVHILFVELMNPSYR